MDKPDIEGADLTLALINGLDGCDPDYQDNWWCMNRDLVSTHLAMCINHIAHLEARVKELEAANAWQPIETLPIPELYESSGPVIFRAIEGGNVRVGEGYIKSEDDWDSDEDDAVKVTYWWANDSCGCCHDAMYNQPTHWRPLPSPPEGV
jgi:hypothetical protein